MECIPCFSENWLFFWVKTEASAKYSNIQQQILRNAVYFSQAAETRLWETLIQSKNYFKPCFPLETLKKKCKPSIITTVTHIEIEQMLQNEQGETSVPSLLSGDCENTVSKLQLFSIKLNVLENHLK